MRRALPLWLLCLAACSASAPPVETPAERAITPVAFKLLAPSGARALLLGSIHVAPPQAIHYPRPIESALRHAELLVFEIDLVHTSTEDTVRAMFALGLLPQDRRLRDLVSEETWELVERRAPEAGVPIAAIDRLEPWVVALQFVGISLARAGFEVDHGVERSILAAAGERPIAGLETPREQLRVFDELSAPVQERMLRDALEPSDDAMLESLLEAWRRGDADALEALLFEERDDPVVAPLYEAVYPRRNRSMAASLTRILEDVRTAFVVVGVGHLVGERSLPDALLREGFVVQRIDFGP